MRHTVSLRLVLLSVAVCVLTPAVQPVAAGQAGAAQTTDRFDIPATDDGLPGVGPIRRYDWFQKLWHDRRAAWASAREKDTGAVVFLGDSITQLWEEGLPAAFPGDESAEVWQFPGRCVTEEHTNGREAFGAGYCGRPRRNVWRSRSASCSVRRSSTQERRSGITRRGVLGVRLAEHAWQADGPANAQSS